MAEFCMQNEFCAVLCSLSAGREIKPLFLATAKLFFPGLTSKIRLYDNKICVVKRPCLQCLTC